jgi:hypothetical protein
MVREQELQCVLARGQLQHGLGLSAAEVNVLLVRGNGRTEGRRCAIQEQVVVPRLRLLHARWSDAHALEAEEDCDGARQRVAIFRRDDVDPRARGRGRLRDRFIGSEIAALKQARANEKRQQAKASQRPPGATSSCATSPSASRFCARLLSSSGAGLSDMTHRWCPPVVRSLSEFSPGPQDQE